jgi:putative transcriptional regulator
MTFRGDPMSRKSARHLALGLLLAALGSFPPAGAQVEVTYIANEGFLLEGGGKKVLIDALFEGGVNGYAKVPHALRSELERAEAPFDGIDLVLVTHFHADHFAPGMVGRYLRTNQDASFVSTPQVREQLRPLIPGGAETDDRVTGVLPDEGTREVLTRGGVELEVLNLHHGEERRPPVQNLGFIVKLGGMKILHVGDTEATAEVFEKYSLAEEKIDVALLPSWFLTYDRWIEAVRNEIAPAEIVVMHMPSRDAPPSYFGSHGSYDGTVRALREEFPRARIPDEPGASMTFAAKPAKPESSRTNAVRSILPARRSRSTARQELDAGMFLVAKREMLDPNFAKTVVLLLSYDVEGALGLVVNRPSEMTLSKVLPDVEALRDREDPVFVGGPVPGNKLFLLVRSADEPEDSRRVLEDVFVSQSRELLEQLAGENDGTDPFRLYVGYAGWASGQLDHEVARGDWHVVAADGDAVFSERPKEIWNRLIPPVPTQQVLMLPLPDGAAGVAPGFPSIVP